MTDPLQPPTPPAAQRSAGGPGGPPVLPIWRRPPVLIGVASSLLFVLLAAGSVFVGIGVGGRHPAASPTASASAAPTRAVPASRVSPTAIPTCSITPLISSPALVKAYGSVVQTATGKSVYALNDGVSEPPASGMKVLTAAAAIATLGPDYQITTQVVDDPTTPGSIVLVGQGDATLSRLAANQSVYPGAPTLASLASKTIAAYATLHPRQQITQVVVDSSYWDPNDNWLSSWPRTEQTGGFLSEVTALQVDGDRANPKLQVSPRGTDPVTTAGNLFVTALGLNPANVTVKKGTAEDGATQLASAQSQPVKTLISQMLLTSDNTLAEMLARIVSVKEGQGGSSSSLQGAITAALGKLSIDTSSIIVADGSGESSTDGVPPLFMAKLMALVSQGQNGLNFVAAGLPVAGKTGSLAGRFKGPNAVAAGKITAKPGFIASAYSLSGYMTAADGTALSFAFYGVGPGITTAAQGALDTLATGVYNCGKNLTSH